MKVLVGIVAVIGLLVPACAEETPEPSSERDQAASGNEMGFQRPLDVAVALRQEGLDCRRFQSLPARATRRAPGTRQAECRLGKLEVVILTFRTASSADAFLNDMRAGKCADVLSTLCSVGYWVVADNAALMFDLPNRLEGLRGSWTAG